MNLNPLQKRGSLKQFLYLYDIIVNFTYIKILNGMTSSKPETIKIILTTNYCLLKIIQKKLVKLNKQLDNKQLTTMNFEYLWTFLTFFRIIFAVIPSLIWISMFIILNPKKKQTHKWNILRNEIIVLLTNFTTLISYLSRPLNIPYPASVLINQLTNCMIGLIIKYQVNPFIQYLREYFEFYRYFIFRPMSIPADTKLRTNLEISYPSSYSFTNPGETIIFINFLILNIIL